MKLRTTLAVVALGLLAWLAIRLLGDPPRPPAARQALVDPQRLAAWEQIDLKLLGGSHLRLERKPGGGVDVRFGAEEGGASLAYRDVADLDRVKDLLGALRDGWREALEGSSEDDVLRLGLASPRYALTLRGGGGETTLQWGNDDPTGSGIFGRVTGEPELFRTGREVANLLDENLRSFRSPIVVPFDSFQISEIVLTLFPEDPALPASVLTAVREGGLRDWRLLQPRSLPADPEACRTLAHLCSQLRVSAFMTQSWTQPIRDLSGLPDQPRASLTISAGDALIHLSIGKEIDERGYSVTCEQRDPELCFTVHKAALDRILATTVDSLRPRRLWPRIESVLVGARCDLADGTPVWRVEREALHPGGAWRAAVPFVGPVNVARGRHSFGQIVAELDRVEIAEFLPPETPFTPEARLTLQWKADPVLPVAVVEIARDGARTLVRDPRQPGELFAVGPRLGALIEEDLELYRDPVFLPRAAWELKTVRLRLLAGDGRVLEVARPDTNKPYQGAAGTPADAVPRLQSAAAELWDMPCTRYVRRAEVLGAQGAADPFATVACELTLTALDDEVKLIVSGGDEAPEGGLYCRLEPRLPADLWLVIPRATLQSLLRL